jgi:hypothetical protein
MNRIVRLDHNVRRLVVRRVNEHALAALAASKAGDGKLGYACAHGGGVANCYGYPAETEVALAISDGLSTVVYLSRVPARNVTYHKAANACVPTSGVLWRRGSVSMARRKTAQLALRNAFDSEFTSIERLAAASGCAASS